MHNRNILANSLLSPGSPRLSISDKIQPSLLVLLQRRGCRRVLSAGQAFLRGMSWISVKI
jgi:hypothetical protein